MQRIGYLLLLGAAEEGTHAVRKGDLEGKEQNDGEKRGKGGSLEGWRKKVEASTAQGHPHVLRCKVKGGRGGDKKRLCSSYLLVGATADS